MVRMPCCEKMGVKKGPWTPEEDQILVSYIQQYGHENWRALPRQAGLLRCGKSCRLRWINYLRPDIKRGNFTKEDEEAIVHLHQLLGNRWSAIAAKLPGRTDNEIKNFWHTHLKKKFLRTINSNPIINKVMTDHHHRHDSVALMSYAKEDDERQSEDATWDSKYYTGLVMENPRSINTDNDRDGMLYSETKSTVDEEIGFWYDLLLKSSGEHS